MLGDGTGEEHLVLALTRGHDGVASRQYVARPGIGGRGERLHFLRIGRSVESGLNHDRFFGDRDADHTLATGRQLEVVREHADVPALIADQLAGAQVRVQCRLVASDLPLARLLADHRHDRRRALQQQTVAAQRIHVRAGCHPALEHDMQAARLGRGVGDRRDEGRTGRVVSRRVELDVERLAVERVAVRQARVGVSRSIGPELAILQDLLPGRSLGIRPAVEAFGDVGLEPIPERPSEPELIVCVGHAGDAVVAVVVIGTDGLLPGQGPPVAVDCLARSAPLTF